MSGEVIIECREDVLWLTLSNPGKRNSISMSMYNVLEEELLRAAEDRTLRAVVLKGAGGSFAGGTDISHLAEVHEGRAGVDYEARMAQVQSALLQLRIPSISVVRGPCVGGGLVLAAISDLVYCTPDARFGSPIAHTLGNTLSPTSIARLHQCWGPRATSEMLLTARLFSAEEAKKRGFITAIVAGEDIDEHVDGVLNRIRAAAPITLWSIKEFERRLANRAFEVETADVYTAVYGSADFQEGVSSFLSKSKPKFKGE